MGIGGVREWIAFSQVHLFIFLISISSSFYFPGTSIVAFSCAVKAAKPGQQLVCMGGSLDKIIIHFPSIWTSFIIGKSDLTRLYCFPDNECNIFLSLISVKFFYFYLIFQWSLLSFTKLFLIVSRFNADNLANFDQVHDPLPARSHHGCF